MVSLILWLGARAGAQGAGQGDQSNRIGNWIQSTMRSLRLKEHFLGVTKG